MCSELILALVYFLTILAVNFFLYKLLTSYLANIFELLKMKQILEIFPAEAGIRLSFFYLYGKNEVKDQISLRRFHLLNECQDVLVLGNCYAYFEKIVEKKGLQVRSFTYYSRLLENQYLSKDFIKTKPKLK